jgi:aryl-alcohol dehydrogenase-like predicted oxidoreductase
MTISIPLRQGFGGAPLGNMFRAIPEEEAIATVADAWDAGIRYFDTAPMQGFPRSGPGSLSRGVPATSIS